MGRPLYTNNAATYLAFGITNTATTMQVSANTGHLFPSPVGGDYFYVSLISLSGPIIEIVKCTARSGDIFTIERGQEGTSPLYWNMGDNVQLRITAAGMNFIAGSAVQTTEEQSFIATQGQTVFTLTSFDYAPGTNNLAVFVNGSKQVYGINYSETSVNTVTFNSGLNAGDVVEFLVGASIASGTLYATDIRYTPGPNSLLPSGTVETALNNLSDKTFGANYVGYNQGGTGSANITVTSKLQEIVSVKDFGAKGDGTTNDTVAFQNFSNYINSVGGGTYLIPPGNYIVGSQTFAGATGKGYSYLNAPILTITNCTKDVEILGYGATLTIASGLKYGAFDPVTGLPYASTSPFYNADYYAIVGNLVDIENNTGKVTVRGLELNGNQAGFVLGGPAGDTGIQLAAYGVLSLNNAAVHLEDIYTHHNGLDGVYSNYASTHGYNEKAYPTTLINVRSEYNARQGLSYTGGKGLTAINCQFNNTGQGSFSTSPSAGLDLEGEGSGYVVSGVFINCEFANNHGAAVLGTVNYVDIAFYECSFYGTTSAYALYTSQGGLTFTNCIVGGANYIGGVPGNNIDRNTFQNCHFIANQTWQGISSLWAAHPIVDSTTGNPVFDSCQFDSAGGNVSLNYSTNATTYISCTFTQDTYTGISYTRGTYSGLNTFNGSTGSFDLNGSVIYNPIRLLGAATYSSVKYAADVSGGYTAYSTSNNFTSLGKNTYISPILVAGLPSASTVGAGSVSFVTDATATTFGTIVAGGGTNNVPVYSDGTNWRIG